MKIKKVNNTYNVYSMELSWTELEALQARLEKDHSGPAADDLYQTIDWYLKNNLPQPGEDDKKKDDEAPAAGEVDKIPDDEMQLNSELPPIEDPVPEMPKESPEDEESLEYRPRLNPFDEFER